MGVPFLSLGMGVILSNLSAAAPGDLLAILPAEFNAPADLTYDEVEGTYWVVSYLRDGAFVLSRDLRELLRNVPLPYRGDGVTSRNTGIAYDPLDDTFWVSVNLALPQIDEFRRDGTPTGRVIYPPSPGRPVGCSGAPTFVVLGLAFDPTGSGGAGSLYAVLNYNGLALIDEFGLEGGPIRSFPDLDDPSRFVGMDCNGTVTDLDPVFEDGALAGFHALATWNGLPHAAMKLDAAGKYTGSSVSLISAGGAVAGLLHRSFPDPESGEEQDSLVCTVPNTSRFAVLHCGEPEFRELTNLQCGASDRTVTLTWVRGQAYDSIEVLRNCEVLEVLPGTSDRWEGLLPVDGVHELRLRARWGIREEETDPCEAVVGAGQILRSADLGMRDESERLMDLGWDGRETLVVTDSKQRRLVFYDLDLQELGSHSFEEDSFFSWTDRISGVAYGGEPGTIFLYNTVKNTVARMALPGTVLGTWPAPVPRSPADLEAGVDRRDVRGMSYDPRGDGGKGSLWVVEQVRGWLYELDLQGKLLREVPHPYLFDPTPWKRAGSHDVSLNGIEVVPGDGARQVYLSGARPGRGKGSCGIDQELPLIFRFGIESASPVAGSGIPAAALESGGYCLQRLSFQAVAEEDRVRLYLLNGSEGRLVEIETRSPSVVPPDLLSWQATPSGAAELRFRSGDAYDSIEVIRDCVSIALLPKSSTTFTDSDPGAGYHRYALRGIRGGAFSPFASGSLRTGPGSVLQYRFTWPPKPADQITRDPVDGSFYGTASHNSTTVHHFDRDLRYLESWGLSVESPWVCRTLAVRSGPAERLLYYIAAAGFNADSFQLVSERLGGGLVNRVEITPPQPRDVPVKQPWGLAWEPASDTFYYQERNSNTFVQMSPDGRILRTFPHPSPPVGFTVEDWGVTVVPHRGTLLCFGSDPRDREVSRILEMSFDGVLTGYQIPIPPNETGVVARGLAFVAPGEAIITQAENLLRIQAFDPDVQAAFIRGDANGDLRVDISDAVSILAALFNGGAFPACAGAADTDDSGNLDITDAIRLLVFLFLGGEAPPPPHPALGPDPTPDALPCR